MGSKKTAGVRAGLDLGGTKIQAAVLSDADEVVGAARTATPRTGGPDAITAALADTLRTALDAAGLALDAVAGIGVGTPGAVNASKGTVSGARNLDGFDGDVALAALLQRSVDRPVKLGNDVGVALEAEARLGAGAGVKSFLGVWWGTGIGGGVVIDGRRWLGRGAAGEIGHAVVRLGGRRCPCGRKGCVEAYAGRRALEARARRLADRGTDTRLFKIAKKKGREHLTSGVWARALDRDDALAKELLDEAVAAIAAGAASAVNLLDVEAVVIGGGLGTRLGEPYARRIAAAMVPHLFVPERPPSVRLSSLGDLSGAIGAALLQG